MQPPGGSSNLFGEDEDGGEEEAKAPAAKKPDRWEVPSIVTPHSIFSRRRMKSSFELGGYEKEDEVVSPQARKTKTGMNPITGTVVGEDGKEVAVTMVQMVEKFEKSCKVTLMTDLLILKDFLRFS